MTSLSRAEESRFLTSPTRAEERRPVDITSQSRGQGIADINSQSRGEWFPDIRVKEIRLLNSSARPEPKSPERAEERSLTDITSHNRGELLAYISNQGREEEAC